MVRIKQIIVSIISLFIMTSCATTPTQVGVPLPTTVSVNTPTPDPLDPSAYSTAVHQSTALAQQQQALANEAQLAQATLQHQSLVATQQSEQLTRQVDLVATATANAVIGNQTSTAVSIEATERSVSAYSTALAAEANATSNAVSSLLQSTVNAASAQGTANAIYAMATLESDLTNIERDRLERENKAITMRELRKNVMMVVAIALVAVIIVVAWTILHGRQTPTIIERPNQAPQVFIWSGDGLKPVALPVPQRQLVSANTPSPNHINTSTINNDLNGIRAASWERFSGWQDMRYIPIGASDGGPIMIDTAREPHVMIAGQTGSGKTRRAVWPLVSACVASGSYVVLVNERGSDFKPFYDHPNVSVIRGSRVDMPGVTADLLQSAVAEMDRRDNVLRQHGVSTWNRLPDGVDNPAEIVIVIDEFLALVRAQHDKVARKAMMEAVIQLSSEARKFGIRLIITVTSPSRRALGKEGMTLRDQCGRIAFSLKDGAVSYAFMNDHTAVNMPDGHFMANVGKGVQKGVSFTPSEEQIKGYLLTRRVRQVTPPRAIVNRETSYSSGAGVIIEQDPNDPLNHEKAPDIISYVRQNPEASLSQIATAIFGTRGGNGFYVVREVVDTIKGAEEVMA